MHRAEIKTTKTTFHTAKCATTSVKAEPVCC